MLHLPALILLWVGIVSSCEDPRDSWEDIFRYENPTRDGKAVFHYKGINGLQGQVANYVLSDSEARQLQKAFAETLGKSNLTGYDWSTASPWLFQRSLNTSNFWKCPELKSEEAIELGLVPCEQDESFRCRNGQCIPLGSICNGKTNCLDDSDEALDMCTDHLALEPLMICKAEEFKCNNGQCILLSKVCDMLADCGDGSDEFLQDCLAAKEARYNNETMKQKLCRSLPRHVEEQLWFQGHWRPFDHVHLKEEAIGSPTGTRLVRYVCRTSIISAIIPGYSKSNDAFPKKGFCYAYGEDKKFLVGRMELLVSSNKREFSWEKARHGQVGNGAVIGGITSQHQIYFICCINSVWGCRLGKLLPHLGYCHTTLGQKSFSYSVLVNHASVTDKPPSQMEACAKEEFSCGVGPRKCIPHKYTCDGHKDCVDASDELQANCAQYAANQLLSSGSPKNGQCRLDQFQCQSGECKDLMERCNKVKSCLDGSDEKNCQEAPWIVESEFLVKGFWARNDAIAVDYLFPGGLSFREQPEFICRERLKFSTLLGRLNYDRGTKSISCSVQRRGPESLQEYDVPRARSYEVLLEYPSQAGMAWKMSNRGRSYSGTIVGGLTSFYELYFICGSFALARDSYNNVSTPVAIIGTVLPREIRCMVSYNTVGRLSNSIYYLAVDMDFFDFPSRHLYPWLLR